MILSFRVYCLLFISLSLLFMHIQNHQKNSILIYAFVLAVHGVAIFGVIQRNQFTNNFKPPIAHLQQPITMVFDVQASQALIKNPKTPQTITADINKNQLRQIEMLEKPAPMQQSTPEKITSLEEVDKKQIKTLKTLTTKEIKKPDHIKQNQNALPLQTSISQPLQKNKEIIKEISKDDQQQHYNTMPVLKKAAEEMKDVQKPTDPKTIDLDRTMDGKNSSFPPQTTQILKNTQNKSENKNQKARYLGAKPPYPEASRLNDESGIIELEVQIDEKGQLKYIKMLKSSGFYRLDTAVQAHLKTSKWQPAIENGKSEIAALVLRFIYNLDD
jgi:TonB family protein